MTNTSDVARHSSATSTARNSDVGLSNASQATGGRPDADQHRVEVAAVGETASHTRPAARSLTASGIAQTKKYTLASRGLARSSRAMAMAKRELHRDEHHDEQEGVAHGGPEVGVVDHALRRTRG